MPTITDQIMNALDEVEHPTRDDLQRIADRFGKPLRYIQAILYQNNRFPQAKLLHDPKVQAILRLFHTEKVLRTAQIREAVRAADIDTPEEGRFNADSEVNLYLRRLVEAGILIRIKRGYYRVSEMYHNEVFRSWDRTIIAKYPTPYIGNDDMLITIYGMDDAVFSQKRHGNYSKNVLRMIQIKNSIQNLVEKMVGLNIQAVESQMHDIYLDELKKIDRASVRRFLNKHTEFNVFNLARLTAAGENDEQVRSRLRELFDGWLAVYPAPDHLVVPRTDFYALSTQAQSEVIDFLIQLLEERPIDDPSTITVVCHSQNTVGRELTQFMG